MSDVGAGSALDNRTRSSMRRRRIWRSCDGPGAVQARTPEAAAARALTEDAVSFARPRLMRLPATQRAAEAARLQARWRFYLLSVPIWRTSSRGQDFSRLEIKVTFRTDDAENARPFAYDVMPNHDVAQRFHGEEIDVEVGADVTFGVRSRKSSGDEPNLPPTAPPVGLRYRVPSATVQNSNTGVDHVFWRLDGRLAGGSIDLELHVILCVPVIAEELSVDTHVRATRHVNLLDAGLRSAVRDLPAALRNFFSAGTPIGATRTWDLSDML